MPLPVPVYPVDPPSGGGSGGWGYWLVVLLLPGIVISCVSERIFGHSETPLAHTVITQVPTTDQPTPSVPRVDKTSTAEPSENVSDEPISSLKEEIDMAMQAAETGMSVEQQQNFKASQSAWFDTEIQSCQGDENCLRRAYNLRIHVIETWFSTH